MAQLTDKKHYFFHKRLQIKNIALDKLFVKFGT